MSARFPPFPRARETPTRSRKALPPHCAAPALVLLALAACRPGEAVPSARSADRPDAPDEPAAARALDADRAWAHLERIVAFGSRPAGSESLERLRGYLVAELEALGLEPRREAFREDTPVGPIDFVNVHADLPGASSTTIVLASHIDTKVLPFEFVGANDSGSSTALLLELARVLSGEPGTRPVTYRLLFLDGEESVSPAWSDDSLYGSRHHVEELRRAGELRRIGACVLLDLVGDADLALERDVNSTPELVELFFRTARSLGLEEHLARWPREILDDHLPFLAAGIPSIDLIDLEYGPSNSYWHSPEDVLANCSRDSLEVVGRIVLAALPELERRVLSGRLGG